jgi:hypothetical protein
MRNTLVRKHEETDSVEELNIDGKILEWILEN